jgi:hypothetical protein
MYLVRRHTTLDTANSIRIVLVEFERRLTVF